MSTRGLLIAVGAVCMLSLLSCMTQAVNIRRDYYRDPSYQPRAREGAQGRGFPPKNRTAHAGNFLRNPPENCQGKEVDIMISAEEWDKEFSGLEAELEAMRNITPEQWEREFLDLSAGLDKMGDPFSTGPEDKQ